MYFRTLLLAFGMSIYGASAVAQEHTSQVLERLIREGSRDSCFFNIEVTARGADEAGELSSNLKVHRVLFKGKILETRLTPQSTPETCDQIAKEFGQDSNEEFPILFRVPDEAKLTVPAKIEVFAQVVSGFAYYGVPTMVYFVFLKQM
jgi:hypothetical protein